MHTHQDLITTPVTEELLRGALDVERTRHGLLPHRLPAAARRQIPDEQLAVAEAQPSGVRLAFRTRATTVELDTLPTKRVYRGFPAPPDGVYDLLADGRLAAQATVAGGNVREIVDMVTQAAELREGPPGTARFGELPPGDKDVEIWLPHSEITELIALRTDAPVEPSAPRGRKVWLHHGSSISHGSNAAHPTAIWPALAAAAGGVELVNLGFSGSALLDPFTARAMRDTPADLLSLKIGINIVNTDAMRLRAFTPAVHGFLDIVREGHPTAPLLVVSPPVPRPGGHPGPARPGLRGRQAALQGHRRPGGTRRGPADPHRHPRGAGPDRRAAGGRRPQPPPPRRARTLRRGRLRRTAAARRGPPRSRGTPAHRRELRPAGVRGHRPLRLGEPLTRSR